MPGVLSVGNVTRWTVGKQTEEMMLTEMGLLAVTQFLVSLERLEGRIDPVVLLGDVKRLLDHVESHTVRRPTNERTCGSVDEVCIHDVYLHEHCPEC